MENNGIKGYSLDKLFGSQPGQSNDSYLIPIYQRNYAWGLGEIKQLIDDVADYAKKVKDERGNPLEKIPQYYIGTLMVHQREDGQYEVIDGQQRLTTLFLMLCYYQQYLHQNKTQGSSQESSFVFTLDAQKLVFENRPKSTEALQRIVEYTQQSNMAQSLVLDEDKNNRAIIAGFNTIRELITDQGVSQTGRKLTVTEFFDYLLHHVIIYRVGLPADTDLNHYFEVMNSRGEQLEKHEIIKARLLSEMENSDEASDLTVLAHVWDAVANMNQYVQYGFSKEQREAIFDKHWNDFKPANYHELRMLLEEKKPAEGKNEDTQFGEAVTLTDILDSPQKYLSRNEKSASEDHPDRFNSVIQFPAFLLHALKIFSVQNIIQDDDGQLIDVALDDKQLIPAFDAYFFKSNLGEDKVLARIKEFTYLLLKMKYLFDHYVIKREYKENEEGWSLQALYYSAEKNSSGYYRQNFPDHAGINKQILMLQSAFHVSMPTQNYKYWLLGALNILVNICQYKDDTSLTIDAKTYLLALEDQAERFMFDRYLAEEEETYEAMLFDDHQPMPVRSREILQSASISDRLTYGNTRNNFVFNYLDYRLWRSVVVEGNNLDKTEDKAIYEGFVFTFRSSIEHFYPQNPIDLAKKQKTDVFPLHAFGNLCLLSASKNAQLSNDLPIAKQEYFKTAIKANRIDSLKLYKMIQKLQFSKAWSIVEIKEHEVEMLQLLAKP